MGLNGLLGSNDDFSSNFGGVAAAGVWMIVSVILAIIGGIVLYFVVFTKQNEHKFTGTMAWIYDFFTFKKMLLETLLKILYMIVAIYITLSSFSLISISFIGFLLQLTLGNSTCKNWIWIFFIIINNLQEHYWNLMISYLKEKKK